MIVIGLVMIGIGTIMAVVGVTWYDSYTKEYTLTVDDVLAGQPSNWLTPGPTGRRAIVTGLALRSKAKPITEQSQGETGRTKVERIYFPLRSLTGSDNRAILISLPRSQFNDDILLNAEQADQRDSFQGLIGRTPEAQGQQNIEHLFEGVTFPQDYCLFVGEMGVTKSMAGTSKAIGICGVVLIVVGAAFIALHRGRRVEHQAEAPAPEPEPAVSPGAPAVTQSTALGAELGAPPPAAPEAGRTAANPQAGAEVQKPATPAAEGPDPLDAIRTVLNRKAAEDREARNSQKEPTGDDRADA